MPDDFSRRFAACVNSMIQDDATGATYAITRKDGILSLDPVDPTSLAEEALGEFEAILFDGGNSHGDSWKHVFFPRSREHMFTDETLSALEASGDAVASPADDPVVARWAHDSCHVLTIALNRLTGWPILTLHDVWDCQGSAYLSGYGHVLHSGVVAPDGRFLDIRGLHDAERMEDMKRLYLDLPERGAWRPEAAPSERDLLEILPDGAAGNLDRLLAEADAAIADRLATLIAEAVEPIGPGVR